ncbi:MULTISPECIES: hypothetical protein [Mesorhizobium]|uniref:hypothetical protein n=1 Tax=Mesorhizobium TaxID=68287 RepID=UPI001140FC2A|nr:MULTISPECIES: hypothetical protein [Mesorhizobium]
MAAEMIVNVDAGQAGAAGKCGPGKLGRRHAVDRKAERCLTHGFPFSSMKCGSSFSADWLPSRSNYPLLNETGMTEVSQPNSRCFSFIDERKLGSHDSILSVFQMFSGR